jgi:hypothetical protein
MVHQSDAVAVPVFESEPLADRMRARLRTARRAVDRRATATRPRLRQRPARPADPGSLNLDEVRERESLRQVFQELGISYRRYRSQVGGPVAPGLRDAAYNFRAEPSLASLVTVAGFLDELKLLD